MSNCYILVLVPQLGFFSSCFTYLSPLPKYAISSAFPSHSEVNTKFHIIVCRESYWVQVQLFNICQFATSRIYIGGHTAGNYNFTWLIYVVHFFVMKIIFCSFMYCTVKVFLPPLTFQNTLDHSFLVKFMGTSSVPRTISREWLRVYQGHIFGQWSRAWKTKCSKYRVFGNLNLYWSETLHISQPLFREMSQAVRKWS